MLTTVTLTPGVCARDTQVTDVTTARWEQMATAHSALVQISNKRSAVEMMTTGAIRLSKPVIVKAFTFTVHDLDCVHPAIAGATAGRRHYVVVANKS